MRTHQTAAQFSTFSGMLRLGEISGFSESFEGCRWRNPDITRTSALKLLDCLSPVSQSGERRSIVAFEQLSLPFPDPSPVTIEPVGCSKQCFVTPVSISLKHIAGIKFRTSECRNPHTNPSLRTSSSNWAIPSFSWVTNKECQQAGLQLLPASDSVCGRCSSAEKDAEENEQLEEDGAESDAKARRFCHQRDESIEGRKFQHRRAPNAGSGLHRDPVHNIKITSITGQLKTPTSLPQESLISQVPLRLQIKVSGQRGSLGISIAGGKGSLPYKSHDEGIFISRVIKGGASEKAGIHVGDRLLEVNGLNMQGVTHHEAVSALRNAGSCIKMKVLRERLLPQQVCDLDGPRDTQDRGDQRGRQTMTESSEGCFSKKIEAAICNGNGIPDIESDLKRTVSELEAEDLKMKNDSLQGGKQTMTIPRIILTHPSTSDEDVELLTQSPNRETQHDFDIPDRPASFDTAFYPP